MARYTEIAEQMMVKFRARKADSAQSQFRCDCGVRFDTRIGLAAHKGYGHKSRVTKSTIETLPNCPVCGSYAVDPRTSFCFSCDRKGQ